MGGAAVLAIILVDPAGEASVAAPLLVIAEVEGGAAVGALDQPGEGLDLVASIFPPASLHHLVDGVPQLPADQRLVGVLDDDPFFLRGGDAGLIEEALELGASEYELPQVDRVVEDGPDGGGVPVVGLAPVFALEIIGIVLVEVCLRIEEAPLSENLGHPHIAHTVSEHLEDVPHHIGGGWIYDEVVPVGGVFDITEGSVAAQVHPGLGSGPVGCLGFAGGLPGVEGVDHIGKGEYQAIQTVLGVNVFCQGEEPDALFLEVMLDVHSHLGVFPSESGEILHDDRVDPPGLDIVDHPLEIRPFEICPAPTVITVIITDGDMMLLTVLGENGLLRRDLSRVNSAKCSKLINSFTFYKQ